MFGPSGVQRAELAGMRRIDELHLDHPFAGSPHLLCALVIDRSDRMWVIDVTYISMARSSVRFPSVIGWSARKPQLRSLIH